MKASETLSPMPQTFVAHLSFAARRELGRILFHERWRTGTRPFQGNLPAFALLWVREFAGRRPNNGRRSGRNVHEFPGQSPATVLQSEIVVPIIKDEELLGVLDLDSPLPGRFDDDDARGLNELVQVLIDSSD